ncbi:hypothetical protein THAOC_29998, partial [Thalassiosira oceanica]
MMEGQPSAPPPLGWPGGAESGGLTSGGGSRRRRRETRASLAKGRSRSRDSAPPFSRGDGLPGRITSVTARPPYKHPAWAAVRRIALDVPLGQDGGDSPCDWPTRACRGLPPQNILTLAAATSATGRSAPSPLRGGRVAPADGGRDETGPRGSGGVGPRRHRSRSAPSRARLRGHPEAARRAGTTQAARRRPRRPKRAPSQTGPPQSGGTLSSSPGPSAIGRGLDLSGSRPRSEGSGVAQPDWEGVASEALCLAHGGGPDVLAGSPGGPLPG